MPENKEFLEFIYARVEKMLMNDPEYKRLQDDIAEAEKSGNIDFAKYENLVADIESRSEILCYNQGFKDGIALGSGKGL